MLLYFGGNQRPDDLRFLKESNVQNLYSPSPNENILRLQLESSIEVSLVYLGFGSVIKISSKYRQNQQISLTNLIQLPDQQFSEKNDADHVFPQNLYSRFQTLCNKKFFFKQLFTNIHNKVTNVCFEHSSSKLTNLLLQTSTPLNTQNQLQQIRMNTKQLLQIDYNQQHGLILGWRYTDLNKYLTFFRHVIVLFSDNKENADHFLKTYLKKIRPGDLYTILYYNHEYKLRNKKWRQKNLTPDQTSDSNDIIQGDLTLGDKQGVMSKVEQQFGKFSEPIVVTVYLQNLQLKSWFQERVLKQRVNQKYNFLVGLFGSFPKTNITFANKVNTIRFPHKQGQMVSFYLKQVYQSSVLWACVSIQCLNAQITSSFQGNWMNTSFNTIQRIYRGPSIQYQKDFLHFYSSKTTGMKHNLMLKLTYVTLQGRKFVSQKQFSVHSFGGFSKLTISVSQWNKPHYVSGNIWLQTNPFQTFTIVKFGKQSIEQQ